FQTSWFIEPIPSNPGPQTVYFLGKDWAQRGTGVISGLNPGVNHQVRLWARDCFGNEMVGTFAELSTEPAIQFSADPRLTVQVIHPDSLRLRWIPAITEALGRSVQFLSWGIYYGETPDNINELIAVSNDSVFDIGGVDSLEKGFFDVRVISDRILAEPKPHFVWPPPGATVSGMNSILLHDMLHRAHWDSFTVVLDPETDSTVIGSSWSTPWTESGRIGFPFDFSTINPGPHVLRATVVDPSGGSFQTDSPLLCTPLFQRNFFTQWQNILHAYLLDTVGVTWQSPHNPLGIVWHTSKGQHYGSPATIEYEPYQPGDSLIMIKILVPTAQKYLSDSKYDFDDGSQQYIAVEQDSTPRVPRENIACCCDGLLIHSSGNDEGNYGEGDGAAPLGAIVTCVNGEYFVGFAFEVELTLKYVKADNPGECSFGQDCKRTEITEIGQCDPGWKPAKRPGTPTYKKHKGSQYPYDGAMRGNDDYRRNYHGETLDLSEQVKGKIRWWDRPWSSGTIPEGVSIRLKRDASFFARADPECPSGTWNCCRTWEVHWDVVFCEDCSIIQLTPPELTNEQSPLECPGLAGD
ncbi:hypothetical protein IT157_02935, partial [bacterium]|nr:hypothetical protein [bacterium]